MDGIVWFMFCFVSFTVCSYRFCLYAQSCINPDSHPNCAFYAIHITHLQNERMWKKVHGVLFVGNISCICVFECNATMMRYLGAKIFDTNVPIKIECVFANVSLVVVSRTKPVSVGASVDCARKSEKGRYQIY